MDGTTAFILQMALILGAARLLNELLRRLTLPPVLGELCAGIVLGPSLLGALWPAGFHALFDDHAALEAMSTVGLLLLMLLTGLETDVRVLRNLGRAALACSAFGLLVPFASGLLLGTFLDDRFVTAHGRLPLALFLATAMSVSALPVIARILMDLRMSKRNFAIVTLSAAVVDDTIGWVVLAAIAGIVTSGSVDMLHILLTLGWVAVFLLCARYLLYPVLRWLLARMEHELRAPGGALVLIFLATLLCAAATQGLRVHAVFGAFVAGVVLRQCSSIGSEHLQRLEAVTLALFAPMFFGAVGLHVDLRSLSSFGLAFLVLAVAVAGKIAGCLAGGALARMPAWEALAVGCGMSARGAVGLVVAKIGLDMHVLDQELFSILVGMAVATSLLAPLMLRALAHKLPLSDEERLREKGVVPGFMPAGPLRILLPAGGGDNAVIGCHLAARLCHSDGDRCTALHVEPDKQPWWRRFLHRGPAPDLDTESYFQRLRASAGPFAPRLAVRCVPREGSALQTILAEAGHGYDLLVLGASGHAHPLYDPFISKAVKHSPCHVVLVANARGAAVPAAFQRILVLTNGSHYADAAFEVAARYADAADASLTVLYIAEPHRPNPLLPAIEEVGEHVQDLMRVTLRQQFSERVRRPERLECMVRESDSVLSGLLDEVQQGSYDLVLLGAENRSFVERLYLGQHIEAAVASVPCAIALVIPKFGHRQG